MRYMSPRRTGSDNTERWKFLHVYRNWLNPWPIHQNENTTCIISKSTTRQYKSNVLAACVLLDQYDTKSMLMNVYTDGCTESYGDTISWVRFSLRCP
eukprot:2115954-Amphidinium_carterae.1